MKKTIASVFFSVAAMVSEAQVNPADSSIFTPLINVRYGIQLPQADLCSRFGFNSSIGTQVEIKFKSNFLVGLGGHLMFGEQVKDTSLLDPISTSKGFVIDRNGEYGRIFFYERGYQYFITGGKIFPILGPNPNSGPFLTAGVGFLQHKIRIEVPAKNIPQLSKEYLKGYDRLTNGFALTERIGYRYFGNKRLVNFAIMAEFIQAFTKNRRAYNYDLMSYDDTPRHDQIIGFYLLWTIPIYKKSPQEFYYY